MYLCTQILFTADPGGEAAKKWAGISATKGDDFYTEGKVLGGFILAAIEYERLCDSEATSLRAPVATSSASDTYFSLAGISRSSAGKGIYVRRGKKVVR